MKTAEKENFKRYIFNEDGTVTNRATGLPIKIEGEGEKKYFRLTNDEGKREYVKPFQIAELFEVKETVVAETPAKTEKTPRAPKAKPESQKVKHGTRFLNYNQDGKRRVTEEEVRELRKLAAGDLEKGVEPVQQKELCSMFQIHNSTCSNIIKGKLHPNVK